MRLERLEADGRRWWEEGAQVPVSPEQTSAPGAGNAAPPGDEPVLGSCPFPSPEPEGRPAVH